MQTILGAGGAIGSELVKVLPNYVDDIREVSRTIKRNELDTQKIKANLLSSKETEYAVKGSDIVYLTVGLPYKAKVWEEEWSKIINNVVNACKKYNSKLVFFDNVYMYDPEHFNNLTEETPMRPVSRKGNVRKKIADLLLKEMERNELDVIIARAADFYGPSIKKSSFLTETVFNNLSKNNKVFWIGDVNKKHSFTYTIDAAKATALLGNTKEAYNQIWHLPTSSEAFTGKDFIDAISNELGVEAKYFSVNKFMLTAFGIFIPTFKELSEMYYQSDRDYIFKSDKFQKYFNIKPTTYLEGIIEIVEQDYL